MEENSLLHRILVILGLKKPIDCNSNEYLRSRGVQIGEMHIGKRVIVGAGAVVSKDIPDHSIAVGNPIRLVGTCDDFVKRHREQMRKDLADGIGYDL